MIDRMVDMLALTGAPLTEEEKLRQQDLIKIARIKIPGYDAALERNSISGAEQIIFFKGWVSETLLLSDEEFAKRVKPLLQFAFGIEPVWSMAGIDYLAGKYYSLQKSLDLSSERTKAQAGSVKKKSALKTAKVAIQYAQGCKSPGVEDQITRLDRMVNPQKDQYGKESKESAEYRKNITSEEILAATERLRELCERKDDYVVLDEEDAAYHGDEDMPF